MRKARTSTRGQGAEAQVDRVRDGIDDGFEYKDERLDLRTVATRLPTGEYELNETEAVEVYESFEVLVEAMKTIAPLDKWKAFNPHGCHPEYCSAMRCHGCPEEPEEDATTDARPHVVFCDNGAGDSHELALPFVRAGDVPDACRIVEQVAGKNDWVVLDAMCYGQLMELADMLVSQAPNYPEGAEDTEYEGRPMDMGWAVRGLKQGLKVRFHTWDPEEYVTKQGDRIVGRDGIVWRPGTGEILEDGWEACRAGVAGGGDPGA